MENIVIEATESTPYVNFDYENNKLIIKGESYPENVSKFYGDIFESLKGYLAKCDGATIHTRIELLYFNSSSVKVIMNLLDMLEESADSGNKVIVDWCYQKDDETIEEFGEEFSEDLEKIEFNLIELE